MTFRKIYWSDWVRNQPKIEVANMDGSGRRVLVKASLGLPNGLTLVHSTNELCYSDAGTWSICCVNLDDLTIRKVLFPAPYPFGITNFNRTLFWTDWLVGKIQRIGVSSKVPGSALGLFSGSTGKIFGIKAAQKCPRSGETIAEHCDYCRVVPGTSVVLRSVINKMNTFILATHTAAGCKQDTYYRSKVRKEEKKKRKDSRKGKEHIISEMSLFLFLFVRSYLTLPKSQSRI